MLIYIHKERELDDVENRYPAAHYVLVDDKLRILTAVKEAWGARVTTIFPRQGHYAHDPKGLACYPPADITVEHIGDLLRCELPALLCPMGPRAPQSHRNLLRERNDEGDADSARTGPEPLARQHHRRLLTAAHCGVTFKSFRSRGSPRTPRSSITPSRTVTTTTTPSAGKCRGKSGEALFFELAIEDLRQAADLFRPIHDQTNGVDGWVSLEVSPLLAHDTAATIAAAKDLHARARRPNLFIKIPGTKEGLPAVEEAIFAGMPVNVTLLFSREQYVAAAEAYFRGIERRIAAGLNPAVGSVASLFISRWDVAVAGKAPRNCTTNSASPLPGRRTSRTTS